MRRQLIAVIAGLLSASCSAPADLVVEHPTGGQEIVLQIENQGVGPMHPMEVINPRAPSLTVYGDGRLIRESPFGTRDFFTLYDDIMLSEAGVQQVLADARAAGLEGHDRRLDAVYGTDGDGTSIITVVAGGASHSSSAWNLDGTGQAEEGLSREVVRQRQTLRRFVDRLGDLAGLSNHTLSEQGPYEPEAWAVVWAVARGPQQDGPWSEEMVAGWQIRAWPLADLANFGEALPERAARCALVEGDDLAELRGSVAQDTLWESGGVTYWVYLRPLLPDETHCHSAHR
ncbi:MAG TPA: hypothetical protein VFY46_00115 [Acidimicrobiia bacterium]|nr:hypothetical protein [Acidimicrobiia bacterium]